MSIVESNYSSVGLPPGFYGQPLTDKETGEVLQFLSERPAHTFGLRGLILSNGLENPLNRGTFYACRNYCGKLEGVGLIGYNSIFEARSERAVETFARLFRANQNAYLLLGEERNIQTFFQYHPKFDLQTAEINKYILYKQTFPVELPASVTGLRLATMADLDLVVEAHNQCGIEETGVDGLKIDPTGFRKRCAHRIEQKNTWIWRKSEKIVFKVEIVTSTPEVTYLESLWIDPAERQKKYGLQCLTQVSRELLQRSVCVCLLVKESNLAAQSLYRQAGYQADGNYLAVFFTRESCQ